MELNDNDLIQIEGYYNKNLSETDRHTFETRVATDKDFAQTVLDYRKMATALDLIKHRQDLAFLRDVDSQMPTIKPLPKPTFIKKWGWLIVVISVLLTLVALLKLYGGKVTEQPDKKLSPLVASVFEPYSPLDITMGNDSRKLRLEALEMYAQKDYKHAVPLLDKVFEAEKDSLWLFYKGVALLGNGESSKAQGCLETLQLSSAVPKESVLWYLALTYIELEQKEKALPILEKLTHTEGENKIKATELIKKIK